MLFTGQRTSLRLLKVNSLIPCADQGLRLTSQGIVSNSIWINFAMKNNKLQTRSFEKEWDQSVIDKCLGFHQRQINGILDMLFKHLEPLNEILEVTLRSGEIFAVDVTGARTAVQIH